MRPYISTIGWALLILVLCGIPGKDIPHISFLEILSFDKWVHAGIFFILTILFIRSNRLSRNEYTRKNAVFLATGLSIPYGGLLEIMQGTMFEDRSADIYDFVANSFGCLLAALLYRSISKKIPKLRLPL